MSPSYVGEIRCFGFNFAPLGWALCNGQIMSIAENTTLFTVIGTTYGGNGTTTFNLPNLQGQIPMHWGRGGGVPTTIIGEPLGEEQVTLLQSNLPIHAHTIYAATVASGSNVERSATPSATAYLSASKGGEAYQMPPATFNTSFSPQALTSVGGSLPHNNMQPYLVLNFCISLYGTFPSHN